MKCRILSIGIAMLVACAAAAEPGDTGDVPIPFRQPAAENVIILMTDGGIQCERPGITIQQARELLENAGVNIISQGEHRVQVPTVCGHPSGIYFIFEVSLEDDVVLPPGASVWSPVKAAPEYELTEQTGDCEHKVFARQNLMPGPDATMSLFILASGPMPTGCPAKIVFTGFSEDSAQFSVVQYGEICTQALTCVAVDHYEFPYFPPSVDRVSVRFPDGHTVKVEIERVH